MTSPEATLRARAEAHARETPDPAHRQQLEAWLAAGDVEALRAAFEPPLHFGTAGVRAPLGPGDARINRLTVGRLVTALCGYLRELDPACPQAGLCIGFDGRHGSARFAADATALARALGFQVRAFEQPVPTPLLAHTTARHGAAAGVMITASHNPPGDNGVKVYWQGGRPLLPPHDAAIAERLSRASAPRLPDAAADGNGGATRLGDGDLQAYLDALLAVLPAAAAQAPVPRVTYSAMCGVGAPATRRLLDRLGIAEVCEVPDECEPHPDFPGLASPNPEHPRALDAGLRAAEAHGSDLLLVHDPDADRLAVAARAGTHLVRLSGDEVGWLLADYLLRSRPPGTPPAAVVTSLVSSELLTRLAADHGAVARRVPTGLKWISSEGRALERAGEAHYLFGYEEALGYCLPALGDDKDGLAALALLVRCWQGHRAAGRTLLDARDTLFRAHGVHRTTQRSWRFSDPQRREAVVAKLTSHPPLQLASARHPRVELDPRAPELTVLRYPSEGEVLRVALRPSGTEPKLKAYLELRTSLENGADLRRAIEDADARLAQAADALDALVRAASA